MDAIPFMRDAFSIERILEIEPGFLTEEHQHEHDDRIVSLSLVSDRPLKPNRFVSWIQDVTLRFFVDEDVRRRTKLESIVAITDAKYLLEQIDRAPEAREHLAFADLVLLNKVDLVDASVSR